MVSRRQARGYAGMSKLRKTLKRIEPENRKELSIALKDAGQAVMVDAIMNAQMQEIKDTGDMIASIDYKTGSGGSTVVIGPGASGAAWQRNPWNNSAPSQRRLSVKQKALKWNFFKGYWAEFGTGGRAPQEARPFMQPAWDANKPWIQRNMTNAVNRALRKAARG